MLKFLSDDLVLPILRRVGSYAAGAIVGALAVTNPEMIKQVEVLTTSAVLLAYDLLVSRADRSRLVMKTRAETSEN